jgi:hypothetical protein
MNRLIATSKRADCGRCFAKNTQCRKRGKIYLCLHCCRQDDMAKQSAKARAKYSLRSLVTFQRDEGIVDSIQELTIDLDRVVSRYVRLAAMDKDHKCKCYTCSTKKDWSKMQCGHYISRQHLGLRWELSNLRVQCPTCNVTQRGNIAVFAENLEKEHSGVVEWLQETARDAAKPTRNELKQLLFDFQQKLKLVEKKLN